MRRFLLFLFCCLITRSVYALTFDQYRHLDQKERDAILTDTQNHSHDDAMRWFWRLSMGEKPWLYKEEVRLSEKDGYAALNAFFQEFAELRKTFLRQTWRQENITLPPEQRTPDNVRLAKMQQADEPGADAIPLAAALAPTAEAKALNQKAGRLCGTWLRRWPEGAGKQWVISIAEMNVINQIEGEIMDQLKLLPKLTAAQVRTAIDSLPEDGPNGVVPGLPKASR